MNESNFVSTSINNQWHTIKMRALAPFILAILVYTIEGRYMNSYKNKKKIKERDIERGRENSNIFYQEFIFFPLYLFI